jgi:hypothetical protein
VICLYLISLVMFFFLFFKFAFVLGLLASDLIHCIFIRSSVSVRYFLPLNRIALGLSVVFHCFSEDRAPEGTGHDSINTF